MKASQFVPGYVSQEIQVESKFTDYELAIMEGGLSLDKPKSALHQAVSIVEAFDKPYEILRWEKGDFGDVDAIARLDDNTFLSIMFNKGVSKDSKEEAWSVEFYRNNSQEVTGEGDAQRVFATVLSAIQTFIKKYTPNRITFSASKEVEQGQNAQSRARLYDSLVQRYARSWGFRAFRADTGNKVIYELSRIKPVAEGLEHYDGIEISMEKEDDEIMVKAMMSGGRELGHVLFVIDGEYLAPQDLEVDERYQGQGIAATMYDYVKSKGYKIRRSGQQTDAGAGFWDKHKPGKNVWEQSVTEGKDFDRCFDQACKLYDRAVSKNLEPKLVQVADFQGDGNGADPRWMKLPQHVWQHYVVIVGDQVLDPTAKQFGDSMPTQYQVSNLDRLWGQQYQIRPRQGVAENFDDGKVKGKSRPGRVKRAGASCDGNVSDLRSKAKNASSERAKMYHWCANMKSGRAKTESEILEDLNVIWKDVLEAGIFRGYPCTKDCSGHAAGYRWSDDRDITDPNLCPYSNNSFWEGCLAHTDEEE